MISTRRSGRKLCFPKCIGRILNKIHRSSIRPIIPYYSNPFFCSSCHSFRPQNPLFAPTGNPKPAFQAPMNFSRVRLGFRQLLRRFYARVATKIWRPSTRFFIPHRRYFAILRCSPTSNPPSRASLKPSKAAENPHFRRLRRRWRYFHRASHPFATTLRRRCPLAFARTPRRLRDE